jgi:predicted helicase
MDQKLINHIQNVIFKAISKNDIFEEFIKILNDNYNKPCQTIQDIKNVQNTKLKGDIFEHFCYLYGTKCLNLKMFFIKDMPYTYLAKLNMQKNDLGIDLIGIDNNNNYYAFQVKYRKPNKYKSKTIIGWKDLSTFFALVLKIDGFHRHVVFTNVDGVRHIGGKSNKDQTIAKGTLQNIKYEDWLKMANIKGHILNVNNAQLSIEEIRKKRIERLEKV